MFVDNKDYDDPVRGDYKTSLVFIDLKSQAKFKVDQRSKKENGKSFRQIAVMNGVHKLPCKCTVCSDGCGSMKHVKDSAIKMGTNCVKIPPRDQSLNEAEKVCNFMWAAARTHLVKTGAPLSLMSCAVEHAMHVDLRMATAASRNHLTPHEMICGEQPFIDHIRPFFTTSHVHASKARRKKLKRLGSSTRKAEVGNLLGFESPFSTNCTVLLDQNRLVRSRSVIFEIGSCNSVERSASAPTQNASPATDLEVSIPSEGVPSIDDDRDSHLSAPLGDDQDSEDLEALFQDSPNVEIESLGVQSFENPAQQPGTPVTECAPLEEEASPESEGLNGGCWDATGLSSRPRNAAPQHVFMVQIEALNDLADQHDLFDRKLDKAIKDLESTHPGDNALHLRASSCMACAAQKDMSWKRALAGPQRNSTIEAFEKELSSLEGTVLTRLEPGSTEHEKARKESTSARFLLDIKRSGKMKARGIKQGFKENKENADGFDFNWAPLSCGQAHFGPHCNFSTKQERKKIGAQRRLGAFHGKSGYWGDHHLCPPTPAASSNRSFPQWHVVRVPSSCGELTGIR